MAGARLVLCVSSEQQSSGTSQGKVLPFCTELSVCAQPPAVGWDAGVSLEGPAVPTWVVGLSQAEVVSWILY